MKICKQNTAYNDSRSNGRSIPLYKTFLKLQDAQKGIRVGEESEWMTGTWIDNHTKGK